MLFAAIFAFLAVSATSAYTPEIILAKWNPHNIFALNKICEVVEERTYGNTFEYEKFGIDSILGNLAKTRKEWRDMRHCCVKATPYQKKECLKDVRENVLDKYCDKGLNHICCKTEYETRYTCFARNPLTNSFATDVPSLYSPLQSMAEINEAVWNGDRLSRQERRRERRMLNQLNEVESDLDNELTGDYYPDTFSYVEDAEDLIRRTVYQRQPMFSSQLFTDVGIAEDIFERKQEIKNEIEQQMFEEQQERSGRQWIRENEAEKIAETLAQGVQTPYMGRRMAALETLESLSGLTRGLETEMEIEDDREDEVYESDRPCVESLRCKRKVHLATDLAAKRVCASKIYQTGKPESSSCCQAGAIVGRKVGRKNTDVCVPALFKFASKIQGCVFDKQVCKQTFVECCREQAMQARRENIIKKNLIRGDLTEEIYEESRRNAFY